MSDRRRSGASSDIRMPGSSRPKQNRAVFGLILCLLAPPLGLVFLWRMGVFRPRGRMLLTTLATVEMAVIALLLMPRAELDLASPVPAVPARVTPAPDSEVLTALSNMDELLYQQQIQDAQNSGTQIEEPNAEAERQARIEAKQEEINNTIVYAVNSGAKYYHAVQVCGNQSNRRSLTVREAILEGLGACSDCNPPSPSDAEALIDAEDAAASGETPAE